MFCQLRKEIKTIESNVLSQGYNSRGKGFVVHLVASARQKSVLIQMVLRINLLFINMQWKKYPP